MEAITKIIRQYYIGIVSGFIFGILCPFIAIFGLVSFTIEFIYPLLFPIEFLFRLITKESWLGGLFFETILFNGILFSFIGYLIQKSLRNKKKNEKIVLYIFIGTIIVTILLMFIEYLVRSGLTA